MIKYTTFGKYYTHSKDQAIPNPIKNAKSLLECQGGFWHFWELFLKPTPQTTGKTIWITKCIANEDALVDIYRKIENNKACGLDTVSNNAFESVAKTTPDWFISLQKVCIVLSRRSEKILMPRGNKQPAKRSTNRSIYSMSIGYWGDNLNFVIGVVLY